MEAKEKTNDKFKCCVARMDKQKMAKMLAKCCPDMNWEGSRDMSEVKTKCCEDMDYDYCSTMKDKCC